MPYIRALPTRVARAMLNLVARPGDRVVDPCCGAGTFLIEAADMGIRAEGFDIAPKMVSASNINLQHFGFAPAARLGDARALTGRWDAVVTDPPYGHIRNYADAHDAPDILRNLPSLAPRIAVVTPNPTEPLLAGQGLSVKTIPLPVSRDLTRYIFLVTCARK
jgi:tRNA G10  N-methylase Trm11